MTIHGFVGYALLLWAIILILAEFISPAAPIKRSAPVFWYVFAMWLIFVWIALPMK